VEHDLSEPKIVVTSARTDDAHNMDTRFIQFMFQPMSRIAVISTHAETRRSATLADTGSVSRTEKNAFYPMLLHTYVFVKLCIREVSQNPSRGKTAQKEGWAMRT